MISESMQDYLKIIYKLSTAGVEVSSSAIAEGLGLSAASVTNMIKKLTDLKLARHTPYQSVELTPAGRKIALEVIRHHRLLEAYLSFLGAGVQPPNASWGTLISDGIQYLDTTPTFALIPGAMLVLTVLSVNVFGDGVRDALDPRAQVKIQT